MENLTTKIVDILTVVFVALIVTVMFTSTVWYVWNHILAPKFDAPLFTFWKAFFTILIIRIMLQNISTKEE